MIYLCVTDTCARTTHTHIRARIVYPLYILVKKKDILEHNLMFCLLGPKDSIVYYNDGEPNDSLQGK